MKKFISTLVFLTLMLPTSVSAIQSNQSDNAQSGESNASLTQSDSDATTQTNNPNSGTMTQDQIRTELKNVKQEIEQNRLRIQELNQIMAKISNQTDKTNLQNQIQILEEQNTNLTEQLN